MINRKTSPSKVIESVSARVAQYVLLTVVVDDREVVGLSVLIYDVG